MSVDLFSTEAEPTAVAPEPVLETLEPTAEAPASVPKSLADDPEYRAFQSRREEVARLRAKAVAERDQLLAESRDVAVPGGDLEANLESLMGEAEARAEQIRRLGERVKILDRAEKELSGQADQIRTHANRRIVEANQAEFHSHAMKIEAALVGLDDAVRSLRAFTDELERGGVGVSVFSQLSPSWFDLGHDGRLGQFVREASRMGVPVATRDDDPRITPRPMMPTLPVA